MGGGLEKMRPPKYELVQVASIAAEYCDFYSI